MPPLPRAQIFSIFLAFSIGLKKVLSRGNFYLPQLQHLTFWQRNQTTHSKINEFNRAVSRHSVNKAFGAGFHLNNFFLCWLKSLQVTRQFNLINEDLFPEQILILRRPAFKSPPFFSLGAFFNKIIIMQMYRFSFIKLIKFVFNFCSTIWIISFLSVNWGIYGQFWNTMGEKSQTRDSKSRKIAIKILLERRLDFFFLRNHKILFKKHFWTNWKSR